MRTLIAIMLMLAIAGVAAAGTITIKGSDTMVRLGQRWAEEFMKTHKDVMIQVSGGGSGTGIAALLNGGTDICEASRDMKPKEYADAEAKKIKLHRVSMALDGIAIFVNDANPVKDLSLEQLRDIYTAAITNWKDVGGPDHVIVLYGRENNSGTYGYFKEHVLKDEDFADATQTLPGTAAVVSAVAHDQFGIGYGGIAWDQGVRALPVRKDAQSPAINPTVENITKGIYPISRELYWFFNGTPSGDMKQLLNWALSDAGQKVAQEIDYVPLPKDKAQASIIQ
ncbi:phosphate-binding protein [candidate division GN15 bacterium]|uniref:Phosphate-binding protein n=1 Tax=candidate division GN15 bacterium TaxID=2072418 RepID=A0A855X1T4_9BACT|nr:MAG: phosphate-binding protein [candidate division GN15 bacterium]